MVTKNEDEYFAREDIEKKRKLAHDLRAGLNQAEKDRLRALHHAKCPNCGMDLQSIQHAGLAVQRCFNCHGTWLSEGVLEKIVHEKHTGSVMKAILNWFKPAERI